MISISDQYLPEFIEKHGTEIVEFDELNVPENPDLSLIATVEKATYILENGEECLFLALHFSNSVVRVYLIHNNIILKAVDPSKTRASLGLFLHQSICLTSILP